MKLNNVFYENENVSQNTCLIITMSLHRYHPSLPYEIVH